MSEKLNNSRLEELVELTEEIDRRVSILAHSKSNIYQEIADVIMDQYVSEIRNEVDEVFAIGTQVSHDYESATGKTVRINIELASNIEDIEERLELEQEVREEIYEKFPDIKNLRTIVHISMDE